jgi:hypothetical protein
MPCIELLTKNDTSNGFKCPVCDEFHETPQNGFSKNINLAKLCEKKANKVSRSPLADALETQLDRLQSNMVKLAHENDLAEVKITEYCDELRNQVQLHLEELTESLKNQSLVLIQKIDDYENEAKLNFDKTKNLTLDALLTESQEFHEKWADYLKQSKLNDQDLKLASNQADSLQNKLNKEIKFILNKVLDSKLLKFTKSTPVLGNLICDDTKQIYIQALDSIKPYNLGAKLDKITQAAFMLLSNGNVCVAYRKQNDTSLKIGIWHQNELIKKIKITEKYKRFHLVEVDKAVILHFYEPEASAKRSNLGLITKFDYNLKEQRGIWLEFVITHANAHENKLYLLAARRERNSKKIYVLDEHLRVLKSIKLGNGEGLPFCVPDSVTKLRVDEKFFVFLDGTNVLLMDRLDGVIKQAFSINSRDFLLDSRADRIMTYDGKLEKLVCFDFEGDSFEISISKSKKLELVDFDNGRFVFFDLNSFGLFF